MCEIKKALISVYDKRGIVEFARELKQFNVEIISTGGTARILQDNGIPCIPVSDVTGFPEIQGGRVKTLHPRILGGLLALRDDATHQQDIEREKIELIDLVVINLYPFEETIKKQGTDLREALENIDIGGPTMIRAAAKNFSHVVVVIDPAQYESIISEMRQNNGRISPETRRRLAVKAFQRTFCYDRIIAEYLNEPKEAYPDHLQLDLEKIQNLRYGENPHQRAGLYRDLSSPHPGITGITQLHGKELSFNNIMDLDSVIRMLEEFDEPCSVIVKHNNPCGVAIAGNILSAYQKALSTDPVSAFGGIIGFNRSVDVKTAEEIARMFVEAIIAPDFDGEALEVLKRKKNLRLLKWPFEKTSWAADYDFRRVSGGFLIQDQDLKGVDEAELKVVTQRQPSESELAAMKFGWKVVKWVKSNAVIYTTTDQTVGIGAGQMSRVDSALLAIEKAKRAGLSLDATAVASDAFFPFRDGIDVAAEAGATAVIQPGGSIRDKEVIQAADENKMTMIFTGIRHFRH